MDHLFASYDTADSFPQKPPPGKTRLGPWGVPMNYGFPVETKPFAMAVSEVDTPRERLSAVESDLTFRFAASVERTASLVSCRDKSMEFLETRRTIGLTAQRNAVGISRLNAIASSST